MPNYNSVTIIGHLVRDPELTFTPTGAAICKFAIAVNDKWKTRDGEERKDVSYIDCVCFGRSGETINQYCTRGQALMVVGKLKQSRWEASDGQKRSAISVNVDQFVFVGAKNGGDQSDQRESPWMSGSRKTSEPAKPHPDDIGPPDDDDIPF